MGSTPLSWLKDADVSSRKTPFLLHFYIPLNCLLPTIDLTIFSSERRRILSILYFSLDPFTLFASSKAFSVKYFQLYTFVFLPKAHEKQVLRKREILFRKKCEMIMSFWRKQINNMVSSIPHFSMHENKNYEWTDSILIISIFHIWYHRMANISGRKYLFWICKF